MTEQLPSTGSVPTGPQTCDTAGMVIVHRFMQASFRAAETLIDRVPDGDVARAQRVAAHLEFLAHGLHDHHAGEDLLLWDQLEQRTPSCAVHVEAMKQQHADMIVLLERLEATLPAWAASGSSTDAAATLHALEDLEHSLDLHLTQEEKRILPLASTTMSQKEWDRLAEFGRKSVPASKLFTQLGLMLDSMAPGDRAAFLGQLPPPVRLLWRVVGRPQYARYLAAIGADPSPMLAA